MISTKNLGIIVILLLAIFTLAYYAYYISLPRFQVTLLATKPKLTGEFIHNPDIIFSRPGWLPESENQTFKLNEAFPPWPAISSEWRGDGFVGFVNNKIEGRAGVAIIHPKKTGPRYIEQTVFLPEGKEYKILIGIANVAGYEHPGLLGNNFSGNCADVGIRIIVRDETSGKSFKVFDKVIREIAFAGWKDYSIDIGSYFSGKNITIRAESYPADNGCGKWNGEWAAIDYLDVQSK